MRTFMALATLMAFVNLSRLAWCADNHEAEESKSTLEAAVASADTPRDLDLAYRGLFYHKQTGNGTKYFPSRHDGIALQAAWTASLASREREEVRLARFCGFLEGRLGVAVPNWWMKDSEEASSKNYVKTMVRDQDVYVSDNIRIVEGSENLVASVDRSKVLLSEDVLRSHVYKMLDPQVVACTNGRFCAVAIHTDAGFPFSLFGCDAVQGKVLWEQRVWALGRDSTVSRTFQAVDVAIVDDRVIVFGDESCGAFVEGFRSKDGQNQFRFATQYLYREP